MDSFVSPTLRAAIYDLDDAWTTEPLRQKKLRLLIYLAREATRRQRGGAVYPTEAFEIGTRGVKAIRGWDPTSPRNDAGVRRLLHDLSDALPGGAFNIDRYTPPAGSGGRNAHRRVRARRTEVSFVDLPGSFWEAAEHEREEGASDELVHVATGRPVRSDDGRRLRERALRAAAAKLVRDTPPETAELVDYLHGRPVRFYTERVGRSHTGLLTTARKTRDDEVRQAELRAVRGLRVQPVPVYTTTARTQRVVPHGAGLATAPSWVRRAVLDDGVELDMASAQLALVAALWDVPPVRDFLAEALGDGPSYWEAVSDWLHGEFPGGTYRPDRHADRLKGLLKTATYGICFGMTERNVARWGNPRRMGPKKKAQRGRDLVWLRRAFGAPALEVGARLLGHPLVAALLEARERRLAEIEGAGELTDVFGRTYRLGDRLGGKNVTARSALAAEAQGAEHFVMLRVARPFLDEDERARRARDDGRRAYPEAEVVLWQSDGFTLRLRQPDRLGLWQQRAEDGLQRGCRELEALVGCATIRTWLELKHGP